MYYRRRTKRVILGFFVLALIVGFIVIGSFRFAEAARERQRYEEEQAAIRPPEPNIFVIETGDRPQTRRYAAQLRPWMHANVPAEVAGRVVEVMVEAGQSVSEGDPLVRLDESLSTIAAQRAQANHEEAKRLLEESARLVKTRAISDTQYHAQLAATRLAEAELAEAREVLNRHVIRAPFNGIVNNRLVDIGDAINVNQPVAELVDLERLRVEFHVSENDLSAFEIGKPLDLLVPSLPGRTFEPTVDFTSRSADQGTRLFRIEAILPNEGSRLPGGLQGIVSTEVHQFTDLPMVPALAVRFLGKNTLVWKMTSEGTPEQVNITVGPELDGVYPVLSGLSAGDRVIVR